jgi:Fanconi-associated nuclease 1
VSRSSNIFASRSLLLEFEASLRTQFRIDFVLEFNGTPTKDGLQVVLDIFDDVLPRWRALLKEEQTKEERLYSTGEGGYLRRLSPAHVYTRIIHKASYVFGTSKFKDYLREHEMLSELLDQRLFHASRRGGWYQRKALLEEHYMAGLHPDDTKSPEENKKYWKRVALQTCEQGLQDNLVHLIYHYDLQKRITKLEKSLKIAKRFQHDFGHARLAKPVERTFEGIQIVHPPKPPNLRRSGSSNLASASGTDAPAAPTSPIEKRRSTKTIWQDPLEGDAECSVEAMCLSNYRKLGYKGFHSEGGIVRTLFALLFYDVLFTYVPNVFQTAYQTCPLDLHTEGFVEARMSEVNERLAEIANGKGEDIVRKLWVEQGEKKTCVVGLDWNFELEDVVEIVKCFEGEKLSVLCKVVAEEYAERGGGVPDLFLWRPFPQENVKVDKAGDKYGEVVFAEVKSENDRLSDTQRLWIHVLTGAGVRVELCHAVAKEVRIVER